MKNKVLFIATTTFGIVLNGCSKDERPTIDPDHTVKIVLTVSDTFLKSEGDYFNAAAHGKKKDNGPIRWKVNDREESGVYLTIDAEDLEGGNTIVIESLDPLTYGHMDIGGFEGGDTPYTISWTVETSLGTKDEGAHKLSTSGRDSSFSRGIRF